MKSSLLSLIIPVKNESEVLDHFFSRLQPIIENLPVDYEFVFVNDGSDDDTIDKLIEFKKDIHNIKIVDLSRNFGKEAALYAGFDNCNGDAAISIDADLQDPPELITEMVQHWLDGYEVVTAVRENRDTDNHIKRKTAGIFYKLINKISDDTKLTPNAGDYRLLNRSAINAFLNLKEKVRFNKGLLSWIGFKEKLVYHKREHRVAGETKWNYIKLFKFAEDGITSFSKSPLDILSYIGLIISSIGFIYGLFIICEVLFTGIDVPGYASLITILLFFNGIQMIGIGILGKYIGRIFLETKQRPIYVARKIYPNITKK